MNLGILNHAGFIAGSYFYKKGVLGGLGSRINIENRFNLRNSSQNMFLNHSFGTVRDNEQYFELSFCGKTFY